MANYKAYPEYKDSGVESLDTIPKMWSIKKLKYIFEIKKRIAGELGFDVLSVTQKGIKIKDIESGEGQLSMDYSKYQRVYPGEFAMNHMDLLTGYVDISNYDGVTSPDYRVFAVRDKHSFYSRYYLYLLQDGYKQRRFFHLGQGSAHLGRWRLPTEAFNEIVYPCPSLKEQIQIASFLDHETAKIDNLIEKQQQLIELLKEKRQAVISHAVTKGLNPDVPMKDSGVEWLGEVPEHWRVGRIKNYAKIESGHTPSRTKPEYWLNCNIPWVSLNDSKQLKEVDYIEDTFYKISELGMANSSAHLLPARAVVFTRDASIGLSAITTKPMAVSQHIIAWVCDEDFIIPEFLLLVFYAMEKEFERYTFGATIKTIGMDNIRELKSTFPPVEEQRNLINWAFNKIEKIKSSIDKVEDMLSLLQERRTTLISAAVTGKIDVRDWVAPGTQESEEPQEVSA
ncbi:restriction endonuclease subunit S [Edwardsiella tarda]|uniref:restriction endonuclease subunit S n=1 Tax=Edwardsiella tarda TaxID=636 RepID=UPI00351C21B4